MKQYDASQIRNIALVGHGHGGKTTLAEAMLVAAGAKDRLGRVEEGTATTDFDADEIKRQMSISAALAPLEWKDTKLNLIDVPGYLDFVGEVQGALRVADAALIVMNANAGLEVGAEVAWDLAVKNDVTRLVFVNRMDRENADFYRLVEELRGKYGAGVVPVELPIGAEDSFNGAIDLIEQTASIWNGSTFDQVPIPADMTDRVAQYRDALVEAAAGADDELILKYLDGEPLTTEEIDRGLAAGVKTGAIVPVFVGSATKGIGVATMLNDLVILAPSAAEKAPATGKNPDTGAEVVRGIGDPQTSVIVWKTTADPYVGKLTYFRVISGSVKADSHLWNANRAHDERLGTVFYLHGKTQETTAEVKAGDIAAVAKLAFTSTGDTLCDPAAKVIFDPMQFPAPVYEVAVFAQTKADEDKLGPALQRMAEEDPTIRIRRDSETAETIVAGMGESHVDIVVERLKRKFGVGVNTKTARVPYRETIRAKARAQGRHKKQSGGRGQFGDCVVEFEPNERGGGFAFVDKIVGGAIPRNFIPAVQKGIEEAMAEGVIAGYPTVDVRATLVDGSFHPVDSSEIAFKIAGSQAFKEGIQKSQPVLLEPVVEAAIVVPESQTGDIISDLNAKRGRVLGMEPIGGGLQEIRAEVPQPEMTRYAVDLRSITRGRGKFSTKFSHYEEVPVHLVTQIVAERKKEKEAANG
ncbi:MAG TPA: elongation factor G [Armatimonadota bacterium]|jgi:elongation factor G